MTEPSKADLEYAAATHEAAHIVVAVTIGWQIGDVSLEKCAIRPGRDSPEETLGAQHALIALAGDLALNLRFVPGWGTRTDDQLLEHIRTIRKGGLSTSDEGHREDALTALAALAENHPELPADGLIYLYRECEREAEKILRQRWDRVEAIAAGLMHYKTLSRKKRRWLDY
jgi:hypothetical protein